MHGGPKHLAFLVGALVVACGGGSAIPTDAEARTFLGHLVEMAQEGNTVGICAVAMCSRDDLVKPLSAPADPPIVIGTWVLEGSTSGGSTSIGGRVLALCGTDRDGAPYRSEILVYRVDGKLRTQDFNYWIGMTVSGGPPVTAPAPPIVDQGCPS